MQKKDILIFSVVLCLTCVLAAQDITKAEVVYKIPGMENATVKQQPYKGSGEEKLMMDIYYPPHVGDGSKLPAVIFIFGYPDDGMKAITGARLKDFVSYISWAKLTTASGMAAILYETRDPWPDTRDLVAFIDQHGDDLNLDGGKICIWSCSGNVPTALSLLMGERNKNLKCGVLYYGIMPTPDGKFKTELESLHRQVGFSIKGLEHIKHFHKDLPLFIVRAGLDYVPNINEMMGHFVSQALSDNMPLTLINYASGHHAFDIFDNNPTSKNYIQRTVDFMKYHLVD